MNERYPFLRVLSKVMLILGLGVVIIGLATSATLETWKSVMLFGLPAVLGGFLLIVASELINLSVDKEENQRRIIELLKGGNDKKEPE